MDATLASFITIVRFQQHTLAIKCARVCVCIVHVCMRRESSRNYFVLHGASSSSYTFLQSVKQSVSQSVSAVQFSLKNKLERERQLRSSSSSSTATATTRIYFNVASSCISRSRLLKRQKEEGGKKLLDSSSSPCSSFSSVFLIKQERSTADKKREEKRKGTKKRIVFT